MEQYDDQVYEKELTNYFNVQYYGTLYIGSQLEDMTFIFDTGSSWFWAPTVDCLDCHKSEKYDPSLSSTYQKLSDTPIYVGYGTGSAYGLLSAEQACLEKDQKTCVDLKMLSVVQNTGLEGLDADGLMGMAPSNQDTQAKIYIEELYNAGIVSEQVFGFYLSATEPCKLTLGGYDPNFGLGVPSNQTITWNKLVDDNYWSVNLHAASLGDYKVPLSTKRAIVDTGTSYLLLPSYDFDDFILYFSD
mmetsp:Transcript_17739/g.12676  ORF Transcript_17739/g.12676 Transcript_17739/m.12676 type:complete len:245 (+) Transcript_17739:319-1053(+)